MNGRTRGKWRRAIGWIAAYALALHGILLGPLGNHLAFAERNGDGAAAFVLCAHDADGATPSNNPDGHPNGGPHCGDCCLGAAAFIEPPKPAQVVVVVPDANEIIWPLADWHNKFAIRHPSQPPRGPPLPA